MSRIFAALQRARRETQPESDRAISAFEVLGRPKTELPGLQSVPSFNLSLANGNRIEAFTNPYSFAAEQFRVLSARLQQLSNAHPLKTILITSADFQEGKSLVCLNLAVTFAKRANKKVLVIEGDVRKPALARMLGLPRLTGLSDWMGSNEPLTEFLCRAANLDLWLLPAGSSCDQPLELVQSPRMRELIGQASNQFDWIVMDSAPLTVADASILSRLADGTLIVARHERTHKKALQNSLGSLEKLVGFVLNDSAGSDARGYDQYYKDGRSRGNGASGSKPLSDTDAAKTSEDPSANLASHPSS
jgi:capsular exopolysaccharide synthesis family protein